MLVASVLFSVCGVFDSVYAAGNRISPPQNGYIDDIYYTPSDAHREANEVKPKYKNGMKEIIFIDDSIPPEQNDTIHPVENVEQTFESIEK